VLVGVTLDDVSLVADACVLDHADEQLAPLLRGLLSRSLACSDH
jgi:hypothetical protein